MFRSISREAPTSKCYILHGVLQHCIDPKQLPSKKKPFATVMNQHFTHTVEVILPEELYHLFGETVIENIPNVRYYQVIMSLSALLEPDFLNSYIKTGSVLMLSEGRPGIDNLYTLTAGLLRLELSKESYERSGLGGKPVRDRGRKHVKTRYLVEINLLLPCMLHGKKGFERIVWAFKNVLNSAVTWLFYNPLDENRTTNIQTSENPIMQQHPILKTCSPSVTKIAGVCVPPMHMTDTIASISDFEDWATETHEWISLLALESPRILGNDQVDSYLCRYAIHRSDSTTMSSIVKIQWRGLMPANWIRKLYVQLCARLTKTQQLRAKSWFSLSGNSFPTEAVDGQDGYTILQLLGKDINRYGALNSPSAKDQESKQEYILWEFSQACNGEL